MQQLQSRLLCQLSFLMVWGALCGCANLCRVELR